jgi:mRNA interferase MazF
VTLPRRGHLYWAQVDKRRPVLVISIDARNERASDVMVVPCTTTLRPAPTHVRLRAGEAGAPQVCMLRCEQVTTLPRSDIEPRPLGGPLGHGRLGEVERAVLRAIGVPV